MEAGVLSAEELKHAMELNGETGLPLGRVLVMCGYIDEKELESAVWAQSLVKDGAITLDKAREALNL